MNYNLLKTCACVFAAAVLIHTTAIAQVVRSATPDSTWNDTVIAPQCVVGVSPSTIVEGQSSSVTVTHCGSPTNPPNQYRWTVTNSGPTASNTGDTYTFPAAGTYCYTVRGASIDGWGKQSPQACVTVNAGCPATSATTSTAACGTGYTGNKFTTYTTTYGPAPACTPTTSSSEDTSGCVAIGCPATSTTTSTAACGTGMSGTRNYSNSTTYGPAPTCTRSDSSVETSNSCACINGATNPPVCNSFPPCTRGACPSGSTDWGWGCMVESSIQWFCTGGRSTIQSQYNSYLLNSSAAGPGNCPWVAQSQSLICGGCTTPGHTWNGTNCVPPPPTNNATMTMACYWDSTYSASCAHQTFTVICDSGLNVSAHYGGSSGSDLYYGVSSTSTTRVIGIGCP